jgi:hypothetical protein
MGENVCTRDGACNVRNPEGVHNTVESQTQIRRPDLFVA